MQTRNRPGAPARPGWRRLALSALFGASMATGQAPLGLWVIALFGLANLTALVAAERRPWDAAWIGWLGGAGYFAGTLFWIVEPFLVDVARHGWMAPFALVLMAFGMALFWGLAAAVAGWLGRTPGLRAFAFALALAGSDLLRSYALTGFPWALTGHIWIGTPVMQLAAWIGPIGLSLLTTLGAAVPFIAPRGRLRIAASVGAVAMLGTLWLVGLQRLHNDDMSAPQVASARESGPEGFQVRLIQPNATQALKWRADMARLFFDRQLTQTAQASALPLDLIVWPESAVPWLLNDAEPVLELIAEASGGVPVALGIQRVEGRRAYNSLAVIDGVGTVLAVYDKWHLVPFGEYIPLGDLLGRIGITAFAAREGNGYSRGPGPQVFDLGPLGRMLPLICYEAVFPQDLRAPGPRADYILQVTNDGWFGNISGPYQHLAQARLRAVEQGLPLLRAANTGVSAVIDAKGRIVRALPLNTQGVIDATLPRSLPQTFYARTGDIPAALFILSLLLAVFLARSRFPIDRD